MSNYLIDIQNVSTGYKEKVLEGVSLSINRDDFIGVIGPNGGGKTTLIKVILGIIPTWSGDIEYKVSKKKIGYLPQFNPFDKEFPITVKDVVLSGLSGQKGLWKRYTDSDFKKADALLERAGMIDYDKKSIGHLSGGQMQRILLCRALISEPELLILDEPSTFVDNNFEGEMFEWLRELNERMAILMVSHDIGTISAYVKTIACVNYHLHYHKSNKITTEQLEYYNCPIKLLAHGEVPHQVLETHKH